VKISENLSRWLIALPRGAAEAAIVGVSISLSLAATFASFQVHGLPASGVLSIVAIAIGVPLVVSAPVALVLMRLLRALESARQEAIRLAGIDTLTGALNRRHWLEKAERELTRALAAGAPVSVLLLDVDDFKQVNDRHGHAAGDAVLKAVADVCTQALRPGDGIARWGGEEFVVLLPDTPLEGARIAAGGLCAAVAASAVTHGAAKVGVTVSIGAAEASATGYRIAALVHLADGAMYAAKQAGKNRAYTAPLSAAVSAAAEAGAPAASGATAGDAELASP
jgi:diguanylate cyclase (GGDEF)-like protein